MIPNYQQCNEEFLLGNVSRRISRDGNYIIFNYTPEVEFKKLWNDINIWCRGIIFDNNTKELVALPFKKFWNLNQHPSTKLEELAKLGEPQRISDKADGSLGILFYDKHTDSLRISTRGALDSDQALWATQWVNDQNNYPIDHDMFEPEKCPTFYDACNCIENYYNFKEFIKHDDHTHLFEIVYKENRIVVNYDFEGLVYLGAVSRNTGLPDYEYFDYSCPKTWRKVETYTTTMAQIITEAIILPASREGWVVVYLNGLMCKIKGSEYLLLHKLRFGLNRENIKALLSEDKDPLVNLNGLPDEFMQEVETIKKDLELQFQEAYTLVSVILNECKFLSTRKEQALLIQNKLLDKKELHGACFAGLQNNFIRVKELIWKNIA